MIFPLDLLSFLMALTAQTASLDDICDHFAQLTSYIAEVRTTSLSVSFPLSVACFFLKHHYDYNCYLVMSNTLIEIYYILNKVLIL